MLILYVQFSFVMQNFFQSFIDFFQIFSKILKHSPECLATFYFLVFYWRGQRCLSQTEVGKWTTGLWSPVGDGGVQGNPRREGFPWADLPVAAKRGRRCTPAVSDPPVLIDPSIHPQIVVRVALELSRLYTGFISGLKIMYNKKLKT